MDGKIRDEFLAYLRKLVTSGMLDDGVPDVDERIIDYIKTNGLDFNSQ